MTDSLTGCATTDIAVVAVDTLAPVATATGGTLTCLASSVQLMGNSAPTTVVYDWIGPNNFGSDMQNPTVGEAGAYVLTVIDTLNGCSSTDTASVLVDLEIPTASAGNDLLIDCLHPTAQLTGSFDNTTASASWAGPNGFTSVLANPVVNGAGTYVFTSTDLTSGCTATDTVLVAIDTLEPGAAAVGGAIDCIATSVEISATSPSSGVTFAWTTSGGIFSNSPTTTVSKRRSSAFIIQPSVRKPTWSAAG